MPKKAAPMPMKKDLPKGMPPKGKGPVMMPKEHADMGPGEHKKAMEKMMGGKGKKK